MHLKTNNKFGPKVLAAVLVFSLVLTIWPVKFASAAPAFAFPAGFVSETVVGNLTGPTTIAFAPDGRMFIGQKDGRVRVFQNGVLLPTDFIDISSQVNNYWDRGLLGIAVHPDFPDTPYVYLLYTYDPPGTSDNGGGARVSRLMRITADPNNTNVALSGSEVILLGTNSTLANIGNPNSTIGPASCENSGVYVQDCIAADSPSHTIGTVTFGTDGSLFVSSGDGAHFNYTDVRALRALDVDSLNGKILRISPITGAGYPDNPFYDGDFYSNRSKVYSLGLRNPFRTTINTLTNEPFIGDVGWNTWEEINTGRGKNFGWPCYEGNNFGSAQQGSYRNNSATSATCSALYAQGLGAVEAPIYAYNHSGGSSSIQAGGFYRGTAYPSQYQDALFISDYNGDWIRYLTFDTNGNATPNNFGTNVAPVGGIVQLLPGPDTNLYYVAYNGPTPNTSEVRRIRYVAGGNTPPTAKAGADPESGAPPLTVDFSSDGTFDPDAQSLTFDWDFGDGNNGTGPSPSHTYLTSGEFTVTLTVTDPLGATGTDTVTISVGDLAPVATIIAPTNGYAYDTFDIVNYNGTGYDNEDGGLSGASLQWDVLLHHNQHVHFDAIPGLIGNTGSFTIPDHGDDSWIELCLTVIDSGGQYDQECVDLQPNEVTLSFATVPSGLNLDYDGVTYITPFDVTSIVGGIRDLIAATTQESCHNFISWSDGGAATHQVTIGSNSQTYIATYSPCPVTVSVDSGQSKVYGDADPILTYTPSELATTFTGTLERAPGETVGTYAINQGTLAITGDKYTLGSFVPADFTIVQRPASVTPDPASKIFGSIDPPLTGTLSGFLPADGVTAIYSRTPGESPAGNPYTISATLEPIAVLGNYDIAYNTADFTITEGNATVTLNNLNQTYDGTPKFVIPTTNPLGLTVDITYEGSTTPPTEAGSYAVVGTINDPNYTGVANGTLVIEPATVNPVITVNNKVYDGTAAATIASRNLNGVIGSDDVSLTGGTANFADPNVGTWLVTATGLSLTGADVGNYQLSLTTGTTTADITPATPVVDTEIHDASHAIVTSGAIGSDVHASATVSGVGVTPTGDVTFTFFSDATCTDPGSGAGTVPLDGSGLADPSNDVSVLDSNLSFQATYNGDTNYGPQAGACIVLGVLPGFTSPDNTIFIVNNGGLFTITTGGAPAVSSITLSGDPLPTNVTFTDNGDGTATLTGVPEVFTNGVYNLVLTASNGVSPDAVQNFTLTVEQPLAPAVDGVNTVQPTPDNILSEFEVVTVNVKTLTVTFDQNVLSVGDGDETYDDSALNPDNYLLARASDSSFETVSCEEGVVGADTEISVDSVTYDNNGGFGPFVATLNVNSGFPLSNGFYRLYVCGTTSVTNLAGLPLAGNDEPGTDFVRNFIVNLSAGGGNNGGNQRGGTTRTFTNSLIPVTGFAPERMTELPLQPRSVTYDASGGLRLEIPILHLEAPVVGVSYADSSWDVTWLGNNAGYLEGTAYPTWVGNTVLTGHVTDANGNPGLFAHVKDLKVGDKAYIHYAGMLYVYEIRENRLIYPTSVTTLLDHRDYDWLTLVTCETYNEKLGKFLYRRMVRAVLISVIPEG
jgi:LPXTG-site transpeptidase (sortase) family protein